MKTLQNNFTTPEQSKRLLELGLSADSADLRYTRIKNHDTWSKPYLVQTGRKYRGADCMEAVPCWSVGRLIEIHDICIEDRNTQYGWDMAGGYSYIEYIISRFEDEIMNFSKLED